MLPSPCEWKSLGAPKASPPAAGAGRASHGRCRWRIVRVEWPRRWGGLWASLRAHWPSNTPWPRRQPSGKPRRPSRSLVVASQRGALPVWRMQKRHGRPNTAAPPASEAASRSAGAIIRGATGSKRCSSAANGRDEAAPRRAHSRTKRPGIGSWWQWKQALSHPKRKAGACGPQRSTPRWLQRPRFCRPTRSSSVRANRGAGGAQIRQPSRRSGWSNPNGLPPWPC
jgi:hypothetical protein